MPFSPTLSYLQRSVLLEGLGEPGCALGPDSIPKEFPRLKRFALLAGLNEPRGALGPDAIPVQIQRLQRPALLERLGEPRCALGLNVILMEMQRVRRAVLLGASSSLAAPSGPMSLPDNWNQPASSPAMQAQAERVPAR